MSHMTNYAENKIIDWLLRGQSLAPPSTWWVALLVAAPSDSDPGTEVLGGNYGRVGVVSNLVMWSGTQGGGSTAISSGSSGTTFNNVSLVYPTPSAPWGEVGWLALMDAQVGGNMWFWCPLNEAKSIFINDDVLIPAALLSLQIDD